MVASLRHSYIAHLGKPDNVALAIAKQNAQLEYAPGKIRHATDLFQQVKAALDKDIRRWIEEEGAYKGLGGRWGEDIAQTTLKTKIECALVRRGFQVEIWREPQTLDGKRPDFVVQYGFVGPVIIEVKLTSNGDIRGTKLRKARSYESMSRYMGGFGAEHGVFLVLDNTGAGNLPLIRATYEKIPGVEVMTFGCRENNSAGEDGRSTSARSAAHPMKRRQAVHTDTIGDKKRKSHRPGGPSRKGKGKGSKQAKKK